MSDNHENHWHGAPPSRRGVAGASRHGLPPRALKLVGSPARVALQLQRLGTRAVVAEALVAEADKVDRAVRHLVTAAADGDLAAAKALIPWLNQALGMPTERVEHRLPARLEELDAMDEAQLERLVARGRQARLHAVPEAGSALDG
jgi:hypothetical protein